MDSHTKHWFLMCARTSAFLGLVAQYASAEDEEALLPISRVCVEYFKSLFGRYKLLKPENEEIYQGFEEAVTQKAKRFSSAALL